MEEQDEIVAEIPVHLSKKLADKLFIIQQNCRFSSEDYMDRYVKTVAFKSENQQMKLEIQADLQADTYSQSKGEEIAVQLEDCKSNQQDQLLDSHNYVSKCAKVSNKYAVGYFYENELHLTPITGVYKLYPDANYLDEIDKSKGSKKSTANQDSADEAETDPSAPEPEKIKVKFASTPSQDRIKRPVTSGQYVKKLQEEPWQYKRWYSSQSIESERERLSLISSDVIHTSNSADQSGEDVLLLPLSKSEYFNSLVLEPSQNVKEEVAANDTTDSQNFEDCCVFDLHANTSLSLLEKCRIIMKRVKIVEFDEVVKILRLKLTQKSELVKALQQSAFLVRGVWIIKSELIYAKNTHSFQSGISSERMCIIRDFVLYLFKTKEYVNRQEVVQVYELSMTELDSIFKEIAIHVPNKGWKLKVSP